MSPGRAFRRLAACAMLAAFGLAATPAAAVDKLVNTPAEKFETAPGGVDMRTGRYVYSETDLAIGGEGSAGLTLSRILNATAAGHANPFGNLSHNWDVMISEKRINADNPQESGLDFEIHVHFAGRSQTYQSRYIYSGYRQVSSGASASLTYVGDRTSGSVVYTYTAADGTVATFRPLGNGDCSSARRCAYVSEIVEADGTRYSFGYAPAGGDGGNARLAQVISSRGYALLLEGGGHEVTKACVLNLTQVAIPSGGACPAGVPTTSYGYTTYSGTRLASVVRADGQTESFTYGAAANGGIAMGFVKPGQPSAWLTNSFHLRPDEEEAQQEIMDRQDLAGGESYSYGFNLSPAVTYKPQTIAGGAWTDAAGEGMDVTYDWPIAPGANHPGSACTPPGCTWPMAEDQQESWVYQQTPGPVSISDALGRTTSFGFCDAAAMAGLPATEHNRCIVLRDAQFVIDPEGIRTDLKYDGNGNVIQAIRHPKPGVPGPDGAVPADIVTSAVYDTAHPKSADKPLSMTDANGRTTSWTYAPEHGGVLTETGPQVNGIAPQKRYAYELRAAVGGNIWVPTAMSMCRTSAATGNPASPCAGGDEVLTTYQYGSGNLLLLGQAVTADGATLRTCFAYDGQGRRISETSPNGTVGLSACPASPPAGPLPYTKSTRYDAMGRVTGTIAPPVAGTHQAVRNSYDPAARLTRVEEGRLSAWQGDWVAPASWTGFAIFRIVDTSYDALDRKTREMVSGDGATASVTEYGYDLGGRLKCTAVRMNPDAWATPLADKCVPGPAHATYGHDRISKNVYDAAGQATESWDGVGTSLARREAAWTYNGNGQKTSLTDSRGFLAQMVYDAFGRQRFWYFPMPATTGAANANDYEEYRYDPAGNRTWLRKRDGAVLTFGYDALSRMTQKNVPTSATGAAGYSVFYGYDNRGLQRYARFGSDSGLGVTSDYDGFGRLLSSTSSVDGVGRAMASQYDSDGNRTLLTGPWGYYAPFAYDGLGRVTGNANITLFGYDSAGRRSSLAMGPGWTSSAVGYQYDEAGRLKTLTHDLAGTSGDQALGFAYNPASQIVTRTASNDAYAAPAPAAGVKAYGVNGLNQYTAVNETGFLYDVNGNLRWDGSTNYVYDAENRLVSASGAKNATLSYDPLGRLWQVSSGATMTRFIYDGDRMVMEYDGAGNFSRAYVHGPGADEPLILFEAGTRKFLHADQQGSIVAINDDAGNLIAINSYDEYGVPAAGNVGRFQYTGQAWIGELGLYYYKARFYSSRLGRFLQTDPIGYDDQINLYAYVGNDPLNLQDATGTRSCGWNCWESDKPAVRRSDVVANPEARRFGVEHRADVHVRDLNEAVDSNEKLSAVSRGEDGALHLKRLASAGASDKGDYVKGGGKLPPNTELAMHGHPDTVVPGPLDDSSISNGVAMGIEHDGRFGILELRNGRYRFTLEKGAARVEPGLRGRNEKREIQTMLDEYQVRLK